MIRKGAPLWKITCQTAERLYILSCNDGGRIRHSPLYIHSFRLIAPRNLLEAQLFNRQYHCYKDIDNIPDRLPFCRHRLGLMQKEVAQIAGISRSTYINLETGNLNGFDEAAADKLAQLFQIPVYDLLDDYNRFLCDGQACRIRAYRESLGMSKKTFAREMGIPIRCLQAWENGTKAVSLKSWGKYFKNRA